MKKDIILFMICGTGFGDQYSSILTAYKSYYDYKKMGYNVELCWLINNKYFSSEESLDIVYDLSPFNTNIKQIIHTDLEEYTKGYSLLPTRKVTLTYVKEITNQLLNYQQDCFDRIGVRNLNTPDYYFHTQFLNKDVLAIADRMIEGRNNIIGVHFRLNDYDISLDTNIDIVLNNPDIKCNYEILNDLILKFKDKNFMICSNNISVREHYKSNFKNVFVNNFTHNIQMYNYEINSINKSDAITHSREILAEMSIFSKCEKIFTYSTFPSNFINYGVVHNVNYSNWYDKTNTLFEIH